MSPRLVVTSDLDELARAGATLVRDEAQRAVAARGVFRLVLSGGDTPRVLYARLADDVTYRDLPWDRTEIFWGDERHVGPADPESNYRMAHEALLERVPINPQNVFRIRAEEPDLDQAAREYEATIREVCAVDPGAWPRFDLVLLGIGADGHTASLFPGHAVLAEQRRLAVAAWVESRQTFRITMTLPVFNHAAHVAFLAAGSAKAAAVAAAIQPPSDAESPPAALIRPVGGELAWLLDAPAAQLVQPV